MNTDLSLRVIMRKHLPVERDWEMFLAGYGDETLALKFFEFFGAGRRKFSLVKRPDDMERLNEFQRSLEIAERNYLALDRSVKGLIDEEHKYQISTKYSYDEPDLETNTVDLRGEDEDWFASGINLGLNDNEPEIDAPNEDAMALLMEADTTNLGRLSSFALGYYSMMCQLIESTSIAAEILAFDGVQKRIDWSVCAATRMAQEAWKQRTGSEPPKTVHADAPGPFGIFLEDVLFELFLLYDRTGEIPPSARSALRALENVTNSGVKFLGNW